LMVQGIGPKPGHFNETNKWVFYIAQYLSLDILMKSLNVFLYSAMPTPKHTQSAEIHPNVYVTRYSFHCAVHVLRNFLRISWTA
jgi:hypothetical protein